MAGGRKQYLLRFPTFEDVRFLDDDNTIESDISDDEEIHLRNLIKCNGWTKINLKARSVHRLLNQYQYSSIWSPEIVRIPESYQENLLRPLSPESLTKIKKSEDHQQEDLSDLSSSSGDLSDKERSRFSRSRKMSSSKPQKRKREESSSLKEAKHRNKKIAKTSSKSRISYKEPIHTLSSEESSSEESNSEQGHLVSDVNGHQSVSNNHTLSPRIGRESPDSTAGNTPKDSSSDSEVEFVEQTAQDIDNQSAQDENSVDNSQVSSTTQGDSAHLEKTFEEHVFTQKDEKEISKYSSLLDPDLVENNNMWILQCPTSMDCSGLVGQKINLNGCSRLDVGDKSYESFSHKSKDNRSATLAVPTNKNLLQLSSEQNSNPVQSMLLCTPLGFQNLSGPSKSPPSDSTELVPSLLYSPGTWSPLHSTDSIELMTSSPFSPNDWSPHHSTESTELVPSRPYSPDSSPQGGGGDSSPPYTNSPEARFPEWTPPNSPTAPPPPEVWNKYRKRPLEE